MVKAVIYVRISDRNQKETSLEAQEKECRQHAEKKGYTVIKVYSDKYITGRTDERPQFQRMIRDSRRREFEKVLVYKLDRFSRKSLDKEIYKDILKKNGVKLESASENIPDDSSGILLEAVIGGVSEWYSADLADKVRRNMRLNAEKGLVNGGPVPLGYKVVNRKYVKDEATAPIVREVYRKYADGWSITDICKDLNARKIKTSKGVDFNKNSLHTMLKNRRYLGIYIYGDIEKVGEMPQIIDEDLFKKVQAKMELNKKAPARARAKAEYLLTGKLFCGHCKDRDDEDVMMIGHSSNRVGKGGKIFNYYKCKKQGRTLPCDKKMVHKDTIEDRVVEVCHAQLTKENIRRIAREIMKIAKSYEDNSELNRINELLRTAQKGKENYLASLRECDDKTVREMIFADLSRIGNEIKELEVRRELEQAKHESFSEEEVIKSLTRLADGDILNKTYRKTLIRLLVNRIYLYDDRFTILLNVGNDEVEITRGLFESIEKNLTDERFCLSVDSGHQTPTSPRPRLE